MGSTSNMNAKPHCKSKNHRLDHNGDSRNVSPPDDADADMFRHQVDGPEIMPETPSEISISHNQLTPVAKKLHDEEQRARKKHELTPVNNPPATGFIIRPASNGSDIRPREFNFAPANLKGPNRSHHKAQRSVASAPAKEQDNAQLNRADTKHEYISQGQDATITRQPLHQNLPHYVNEAPPLFHQSTTIVSSVEEVGDFDNEVTNNDQNQENLHQTRSEACCLSRREGIRLASSLEVARKDSRDPCQLHCASAPAPETRAEDSTVDSAADNGTTADTEQQRQFVIEISNDTADDQETLDRRTLEQSETPAIIQPSQSEPPSACVVRKTRSASSLVVPADGLPLRVTKPIIKRHKLPARSASILVDDVFSYDTILGMLETRYRQQRVQSEKDREATEKLKTRIRGLNHSVTQLQQEKVDAEKSLQATGDAVQKVNQDNESLRRQLKISFSRYRKLKDFARSISNDMKELKQGAEEQKTIVSELRMEVNVDQDEARAAVANAQSLLKKQAGEISSVRKEANEVFGAISKVRIERDERSSRLKDEVAKNRRLESHITVLQTVQQQHDKTAKESGHHIQNALIKIVQRFADLETLVKAEPRVPAPLSECLNLLQEIGRKEPATATDFSNLKDMVEALDTSILTSVEKLDTTLRKPKVPDNRAVKKLLSDLKKAIESTAEKDQELRLAENEVTRLEQKAEGHQEMIEELRRTGATSVSQTECFRKGTEIILEWAKAEKEKSSTHRSSSGADTEMMRVRWQSAMSDLKACQQQKENLEGERDSLLTKSQELRVQLDDKMDENQNLKTQAETTKQQHQQSLKSAKDQSNAAYVHHVQKISQLEKDLLDAQTKAGNASRELENERKLYRQTAKDYQKQQDASQKLQEQNEILNVEAEKLRKQIEQLKDVEEKLKKSQQQCSSAKAEYEKLKAEAVRLGGLEQEATTLQQTLRSKEKELTALAEHLRDANEFDKKVSTLQERLKTAEDKQKRLEASLDASRKEEAKVPGLHKQLDDETSEVTNLKAKLRTASEKEKQFDKTIEQNASLNIALRETESQLHNARQKLVEQDKLQQSLLETESSLTSMQRKVDALREQLEDQSRLKQSLHENESVLTDLQEKFEATEEQLESQDRLEQLLREKESKINILHQKLEAAEQQVEDQDKLKQSLREKESSLTALQQKYKDVEGQLADQTKLDRSLKEKDGSIATLQQRLATVENRLQGQGQHESSIQEKDHTAAELQNDANEVAKLKNALEKQKKTCDEKDINSRQLNSEAARHKAESQQLGEISGQLNGRFPAQMGALAQEFVQTRRASHQKPASTQLTPHTMLELAQDVNFSQELAQPEQQNAHDPAASLESESEQLRRRVADRSRAMKPLNRLDHRPPSRASQPQSTGSTKMVPNSQVETADETLEFADGGDASSLSDLDSENSLSSRHNSHRLEETKNGGAAPQRRRNKTQNAGQIPDQQIESRERPSTAQTDLFNVHTESLSVPAARPSGRKKKSGPDSLFDVDPSPDDQDSLLRKTVAPRDLRLPNGGILGRSHLDDISPRRLRDGTPFGNFTPWSVYRPSTPIREVRPTPGNALNATPAPKRDKPQPNSAAKRSFESEAGSPEGHGTSKRSKRNPENLEVAKPGPKPTPATSVRSTSSSDFRKGGSVMGTNAASPSRMKKPSKPARKGVKKDKYTSRIGSQGSPHES